MKERRASKLLVEPPSVATGDIAFNLIVFFLVCASNAPEEGRYQDIPQADPQKQEAKEDPDGIQIQLAPDVILFNGEKIAREELILKVKQKLRNKPKPEDRVVVVKSKIDVPYSEWIAVTTRIEDAGGIITLELEEEQTVLAD